MWECGVATHPSQHRTRVVVFQCSEHKPKVYEGQRCIEVRPGNSDGVQTFTKHLHRNEGFFPADKGEPDPTPAFAPKIDELTLQKRSNRLYEELIGAIPSGSRKEEVRWDHLRLTLDPELARRVREEPYNDVRLAILDSTKVRDDSCPGSLRLFGYSTNTGYLTLNSLTSRWKEMREDRKSSTNWINDLTREISNAIRGYPPVVTTTPVRHLKADQKRWYRPTVTVIRSLPDDGVELDVLLLEVGRPPTRRKPKRKTKPKPGTKAAAQ